MSPLTISTLDGRACKFLRFPLQRLSKILKDAPSCTNLSARKLPKNPAPPVMSTFLSSVKIEKPVYCCLKPRTPSSSSDAARHELLEATQHVLLLRIAQFMMKAYEERGASRSPGIF